MAFNDELDVVFTVYVKSLKVTELNAAHNKAKRIYSDKSVNDTNKEKAEFLIIKTGIKICAVEYFCNGYEQEAFLALKTYAENAISTCNPTFVKTIELVKSVLAAAQAVNSVVAEAFGLQARVRDFEGKCVARNAEECREVAELLRKKIAEAQALSIPKRIFTDQAKFPDVKQQLIDDLSEVLAFTEKHAALFDGEEAESILRTASEDINKALAAKRIEYFPSIAKVDRLARCLVLCTPFAEEAEIFAYALSEKAKIYKLQALAFQNQPERTIKAVFSELKARGADCMIYGALRFTADNRDSFYRAVMQYCKEGRRAYLIASDGTQKIYEDALAATKGTGDKFTALDVSLFYLSMPDFRSTVEVLKEQGMISDSLDDEKWVRDNMPFAGFAGLNEGVKAFHSAADWKAIVSDRSAENLTFANDYMLYLARQALFIDSGWGSYHEDIVLNKGKKSFDYDDIRTVNPDNIRKIMQSDTSLFQKCGLLATYCMLCGASADEWEGLPIETKSERLTEACKLVLRALDVDIIPVVEVKEDLGVKGAGGLCCDGGKRILFLDSSVKSFSWTSKTICHECFHAFQHKATSSPWQQWFCTELHVTPGRVEQWRYNNACYRSIEKGKEVYMIQIIESDARAFEEDCLGASVNRGEILNLIDFD